MSCLLLDLHKETNMSLQQIPMNTTQKFNPEKKGQLGVDCLPNSYAIVILVLFIVDIIIFLK